MSNKKDELLMSYFLNLLRGSKKGVFISVVLIVLLVIVISGCSDAKPPANDKKAVQEKAKPEAKKIIPKHIPLDKRDYSYGYWLNGWRKHTKDKSPDLLCFESGYYGCMLDIDNLTKARFGTFNDNVSMRESLELGASRMKKLPAANLDITLEKDGRTYRMVSCKAATVKNFKKLETIRLWEAGKVAQHFDVLDLRFVDDKGNRLGCFAKLDLMAWPQSLTFNLEIAPDYIYEDGPSEGVVGNGYCVLKKPLDIPHQDSIDQKKFSLECWVKFPERFTKGSTPWGWILCKNKNEYADGNFGFMIGRYGPSVVMNIGGGPKNYYAMDMHRSFQKHAWNHLVMTYDGKDLKTYVNSFPQGTKAINKKRTPGKGNLRLGQRADGYMHPVKSLYDQLRVWNRILTKDEITAHFAQPGKIKDRKGLIFEENFEPKGKNPVEKPLWNDVKMRISFKTKVKNWQTEKIFKGEWKKGVNKTLSLNCDLPGYKPNPASVSINVVAGSKQEFPAKFDKTFNCLTSYIKDVKRKKDFGTKDARDYDDFFIDVDNTGSKTEVVPFLLNCRDGYGITGNVPILCDEKGVPTGIPVQLSKNWHHGAYKMPYFMLPVKPGKTRYLMRVAYGFWGTVPSASYGQLSLVGYAGNGRWDQAAVGSWGETICFDADMSLTDVAVTDVRCLMLRKGLKGKLWGWSDAGWGVDWLCTYDKKGEKLLFNELKTAYLAHGPCLADVIYDGYYGADRQVKFTAQIQLPRTDDMCKNLMDLKYEFLKPVSAAKSWFYRMGRNRDAKTPIVAYGNAKGLIAEKKVGANLKVGDMIADQVTLTGKGPWWVGFPDGKPNTYAADWGTGTRALIIRSYKAVLNGKTYTNPIISLPVIHVQKDGQKCVDMFIVPPKEIKEFKPGDKVKMDVEFITLPRVADDYFGPNKDFLEHLKKNPLSWKPYHREAVGNNLKVKVKGGRLQKNYPIIIQAFDSEIKVDITGGLGYVPIRFDGLKSKDFSLYEIVNGKEKKLDQSALGNDFWQTDYDAATNTFKMTFNLPLDGKPKSTWVLKAGGR